ncbi:hypothetical protein SAMN06296036_104168 [Pseudobacteriovorax antillogorgiicola]|uniref:Uncharacterized protein n=1 Tax=Pseudobacteriovorax antillogorgiicola TaxID=1513793 RepID=A0A1Y6BL62_9BACT|nr:hypothetical protein EDD56_104165 [Pseudobacteriovorax antillogorgiicola]SMF06826.1 hypothetical protein SAMN06296036_104168 [Pseudobacteriovorax antillogorgiicola]
MMYLVLLILSVLLALASSNELTLRDVIREKKQQRLG